MKEGLIKRSKKNPGAILNTDSVGLLNYKKQKNKLKNMQNEISNLKSEVDDLKNAIKEILDLNKGKE